MTESVFSDRITVGSYTYHVEALHNVPHLIDECCELINAEWKRSYAARKRAIENSCETFPMSLILLRNSGTEEVMGHCKISKVPLSSTKVFVETVIIHPSLRGKGLGRFLMKHVEEVAKKNKIRWIYLTTLGQEMFYEKLGYSVCAPINMYGSQLSSSDESSDENEEKKEKKEKKKKFKSERIIKSSIPLKSNSSAPVPPPLPISKALPNSNISKKIYMRKQIIYKK